LKKKEFKAKFIGFLEENVNGLSAENKIKYMKKWIREYHKKLIGNNEE